MLDWSLTQGFLPVSIVVLGALLLGWLLWRPGRRWWRRTVPIAIAAGLLTAIVVKVAVDDVWQPWPDPLPIVVLVGVSVTGMTLVLAIRRPLRWQLRIVAALALVIVAAASMSQVNVYFSAYQTMRQVLGMKALNHVDFGAIAHPTTTATTATTATSSATQQAGPTDLPSTPATTTSVTPSTTALPPSTPPPPPSTAAAVPMPAAGTLTTVNIPGTMSGFATRDSYIYLPPAYGLTQQLLPVIVLLAGQPSHPIDWLAGGRADQTMDAYAAAHNGVAPVLVVADQIGSEFANPLCVDSTVGNAFTYLSVDVPAWIKQNLVVDPDPKHWAVAGMSSGGTCALQLAVNAPAVYPTFVDISGQDEPTLGTRSQTVKKIFGGDLTAFHQVNPIDVMARTRFPDSAGVVAVGADDTVYRPEAQKVAAAATAAGMTINYLEVPGGHTFDVWAAEFRAAVPWLMPRLGLPA